MAWGLFGSPVAVAHADARRHGPRGRRSGAADRGLLWTGAVVVARVLSRSTSTTSFRRVRANGRQCVRFPWEFELECLG